MPGLSLSEAAGASLKGRPGLLLISLLMLLAGVGLRLHGLEHKVVWHDEVFTLVRVLGFQHQEVLDGIYNGQVQTPAQLLRFQQRVPGRGFQDTWRALKEHPEHSPLYYVLAALATHLTESPLLAVRGTSALLSLLLFPALFWLAREWSGGCRVAWVVVALAAVSPLHLLYAQEARQYALLMVLIAAASAALLQALRRQRRRDWVLYGITLSLGLYTHLLFVQVLLAHALYLAWSAWTQPGAFPPRSGRRAALAAGGALIAFSPWLLAMLQRAGEIRRFTGWMGRTVGPEKLAQAWLGHLNHLFVDLPLLRPYWVPGAALVTLALWYGLRRTPPATSRFLICLVLPSLFLVVLPDLLLGGVRSRETRYLLQPLIGLELVVAWTIAQALESPMGWARRAAVGVFGSLLLLGLGSGLAIDRADSWWSKSFSAENAAFAREVNRTERPLVLGSVSHVGAGELISLSYLLAPGVHLLVTRSDQADFIPPGYTDLFLLLPYTQLRARLEAEDYRVEPFQGSWKWFIAAPNRGAGAVASSGP